MKYVEPLKALVLSEMLSYHYLLDSFQYEYLQNHLSIIPAVLPST